MVYDVRCSFVFSVCNEKPVHVTIPRLPVDEWLTFTRNVFLCYREKMDFQQSPVSCLPTNGKMTKAKKAIEEAKQIQNPELDLVDKNVVSLEDIPEMCKY